MSCSVCGHRSGSMVAGAASAGNHRNNNEVGAANTCNQMNNNAEEAASFRHSRCFLVIWRDFNGRRRCKCCCRNTNGE